MTSYINLTASIRCNYNDNWTQLRIVQQMQIIALSRALSDYWIYLQSATPRRTRNKCYNRTIRSYISVYNWYSGKMTTIWTILKTAPGCDFVYGENWNSRFLMPCHEGAHLQLMWRQKFRNFDNFYPFTFTSPGPSFEWK